MFKFSDEIVQQVWEKGTTVPGYNFSEWRKDVCGAWIGREHYGNRNNKYGWEVDHIIPASQGGNDNLSNLRPLQWENNAIRKDGKLYCVISSSGNTNVRR